MSKEIIISFDDLWTGNDHWEEFERLYKEFPDIKITFFVITGNCSEEFLYAIKQPWSELVFHSYEHSGDWQFWSIEDTKKYLLDTQKWGFVKGFKTPANKWSAEHVKACDEIDYWICASTSVPVEAKRYWHSPANEGLTKYAHKDYDEYYDHLQNKEFFSNLEILKNYLRETKPIYKFISEKVITNTNKTYEQTNNSYYWKRVY